LEQDIRLFSLSVRIEVCLFCEYENLTCGQYSWFTLYLEYEICLCRYYEIFSVPWVGDCLCIYPEYEIFSVPYSMNDNFSVPFSSLQLRDFLYLKVWDLSLPKLWDSFCTLSIILFMHRYRVYPEYDEIFFSTLTMRFFVP